jgi:hypothetical protein
MIFLPLAGLVNIASSVLIVMDGQGMVLVPTFLFFCFLQLLLCILAIQLDDEDRKLALYSPFLLLGYKQLCDFILLKSFFDVVFRKKLKWTSAKRVGAQVTRKALF